MESPNQSSDNTLSIYQRMPDPMAAIEKLGQMFANSGMFGCSKVEQGQVLALACLAEGKSPFQLMRNYHIIGGTLSMRSVGMLAEFIQRGGKITWHSALNDASAATATFEFGGNTLDHATYTIEDAQRERLTTGPNKANWESRPPDMLRARLITKACRMIAPGIIAGALDEHEAPQATTAAPLLGSVEAAPQAVTAVVEDSLQDRLNHDGIPQEHAVSFLVSRQMLTEGKTLDDLGTMQLKKIMKNYEDFKTKVIGYNTDKKELMNAS